MEKTRNLRFSYQMRFPIFGDLVFHVQTKNLVSSSFLRLLLIFSIEFHSRFLVLR